MSMITIEVSNPKEEALLMEFIQKMKLRVIQINEKSIKTSSFSEEETTLLLKINEGLPVPLQARYTELNKNLVNETLTSEEHEELLRIIPMVEKQQVERLKHLILLARLWNMTVDEVMEKLQIKNLPVVYG